MIIVEPRISNTFLICSRCINLNQRMSHSRLVTNTRASWSPFDRGLYEKSVWLPNSTTFSLNSWKLDDCSFSVSRLHATFLNNSARLISIQTMFSWLESSAFLGSRVGFIVYLFKSRNKVVKTHDAFGIRMILIGFNTHLLSAPKCKVVYTESKGVRRDM